MSFWHKDVWFRTTRDRKPGNFAPGSTCPFCCLSVAFLVAPQFKSDRLLFWPSIEVTTKPFAKIHVHLATSDSVTSETHTTKPTALKIQAAVTHSTHVTSNREKRTLACSWHPPQGRLHSCCFQMSCSGAKHGAPYYLSLSLLFIKLIVCASFCTFMYFCWNTMHGMDHSLWNASSAIFNIIHSNVEGF